MRRFNRGDRCAGNQEEPGVFAALVRLISASIQELTRLPNARVCGFTVHQYDLEPEEITQAFHSDQLDAGVPSQEDSALLAESTDLSVGQRKRFTKSPG